MLRYLEEEIMQGQKGREGKGGQEEIDKRTGNFQELKTLLEISKDICSILNLDELLETILARIEEVFGHLHSCIQLIDSHSDELIPLAQRGLPSELDGRRTRLGTGLAGRVAGQGKPIRVGNLEEDKRYTPGIEGAKSAIALPLIVRDKIIGVLTVESHRFEAFSSEEENLLTILAGQIAIAIENARLYEQTLESKSKLEGIFNAITDNISVLSPNYDILMVNEATVQRYHASQQELMGKKCYHVYRQRQVPCEDCPIPIVMRTKRSAMAEIEAPTVIGEIIQMCASPLLDKNGEVMGIITYGRIITDLKRLEEELIRSERLAALAEMAGSIWHELNNYLSVILVRAQLLLNILEANLDRGKALANVEIILDMAQKMTRFTRGLMDLGRKDTYKRPCSLNEIIEKTVELLQPQNKFDDIEIVLDLEAGLPLVSLDPDQIQQILINLLNNAAEAMERGKVVVSSKSCPDDGCQEIDVADDGSGILEEIQKHIFEPHFSTKRKGHGFGLAICYRIVKNHGGRVWVESEVGKGTTFRILIPMALSACGLTPELACQNSLQELDHTL